MQPSRFSGAEVDFTLANNGTDPFRKLSIDRQSIHQTRPSGLTIGRSTAGRGSTAPEQPIVVAVGMCEGNVTFDEMSEIANCTP